MPQETPKVAPALSRRALVKRGLTAGALAAAAAFGAMEGVPVAGAQTAMKNDEPATDPNAITPDDIARADKIAGRDNAAVHRALMVKSLQETRGEVVALRNAAVEAGDTLGDPATHFDPRLPGTVVPAGKSGAKLSRAPTIAYVGEPESLAFVSAADLSRLVKARKITSTTLTRLYLDRLKKFGPCLLCVVNLCEERALTEAARADAEIAAKRYRGPLHGIPYGAKDLLATRGAPTTYGAKPYENQNLDFDATVIKRLTDAGAVLVAKLSMGELAMGDVWFGGLTRNPWDPKRGSSGSSAGPGSATAAGLVAFSIGTETLGSIVSPSVVNGVTGLRPTYGRVSRHGAMALCWTMDKIGPMCRGVEDCALVLAALHGADANDPTAADVPFRWNPATPLTGLRVGIDVDSLSSLRRANKARRKIGEDALGVLADLGLNLQSVRLPKRTPAYNALAGTIIGVEGAASFAKLVAEGGLDLLAQQEAYSWPNTFRVGATVPAVDYLQALRLRARLQREMAETLADLDAYVTFPRTASPSLVYTNLTGHPELVTRCGMRDGLPESISFVGQLYREDVLCRIGHAFEQATPWHHDWPDTEKLPEKPPKPA